MINEALALERFRQIVKEVHQSGETGLLIWRTPEERDNYGKEEDMFVQDAFELHGHAQDGTAYGEYRTMELSRAIRNAFELDSQFRLATADGNHLAAMAFSIDKLLSTEGYLMFAFRSMFCKHLNGPIVSIPSYQMIE